MGLTSAMFTGLTGLNSNQFRIDTAGDNIANINTTAFKSSRANFEDQLATTISGGTAPGTVLGGTNPTQIGKGSALSSVQRNFTSGSIDPTGMPTDMAIEGNGFFIVKTPAETQAYTRDGSFHLDANNLLSNADGYRVQGYGTDSNYSIVSGTLTDLQIPLGMTSSARGTSTAELDGNLNADSTIATQGSIWYSPVFQDAGGAAATAGTLLTNLRDPATPGSQLFANGDVVTFKDVTKGGRELPDKQFTVTATSTLGEYATFMQDSLGINTDPAVGGSPGAYVSDGTGAAPAGTLVVEGNRGEKNGIEFASGAIRSTNVNFNIPFNFDNIQDADGGSLYTTLPVYDSLGTPVQVNLTMVMDSKSNAGTVWRYYAESADSTDSNPSLGQTGTLSFDNDGNLLEVTNNTVEVPLDNTGALSPMEVTLNFDNVTGLTTKVSSLVMTTQDGSDTGSLESFSVGSDGIITGTFSNGLIRTLGQVALANFTNPEGLVSEGGNLYALGPNSGAAIITTPQLMGAGKIASGSLELSNVDLTREFIGLITASTGFSAAGRVITTSNDLLNELLTIAR